LANERRDSEKETIPFARYFPGRENKCDARVRGEPASRNSYVRIVAIREISFRRTGNPQRIRKQTHRSAERTGGITR
jgi:hypothetical protein